ncbi:MAG TPA: N-acetylmuramoyl-L-alanine amidase, partial [Blastocatellia bacterium]|nr:N-acetylmuramoyl-L-alanine amidase [Blastocatellia bacterium]
LDMKQVFISAGHGGGDPGCVANGHKEADLTLYLRDRVAAILRGKLVHVVTDGREGVNKPLRDAVEMAKRNEGPSIELHFNAAGNLGASGVEVLANPELKPLAKELAWEISRVLQSPLRGQMGWLKPSEGQHHRLAFCEAGGLIVEVCFMTNSAELNKYLFNDENVAEAIAGVLARAVNT